MFSLLPTKKSDESLNVLCLGAHCDDIEIGCGATLLTLFDQHPTVNVYWLVFTSTVSRRREATDCATHFCADAKSLHIDILDFRDGFLPYEGSAVKDCFEQAKARFQPDLIFTHYRKDMHQDHKIVSDLTWNTFRNHLILEYEIPKWDGDLGSPSLFVPIEESIAKEKITALQDIYVSQKEKSWFTDDLFWSLMRIRGMECNSRTALAEAFYARKITVDTFV